MSASQPCTAALDTGGKRLVCQLVDGHEGLHGVWPEAEPPTQWSDDAVGAVLPSRTGQTPPEASNGGSGQESESEEASGGLSPDDEIKQTAPVFVSELVMGGHVHWLQKLPGGGMQLKLCAAMPSPQGPRLQMPAYVFEFTREGWENFKRAVEADGDVSPIAIATHLPPGVG